MTAWRFLFLSLLLHFIIWFGLLNRLSNPFLNENKSIEVTIVDPSRSKSHQQIVRQSLIPQNKLVPPSKEKAKFLSERDQNVARQTKARVSGLTHNGNSDKLVSSNKELVKLLPRQNKPVSTQEGVGTGGPHGEINLSKIARNLLVTSSSGEYLPDVADGPITALNSERFVYYSFFSRIEERIRPLWEKYFFDAMNRMNLSQQTHVAGHQWTTVIDVVTDAKGLYLKTIIEQSSSVDALDQTPIKAFQEAAFFPNPPQGLIQKDGKIHLKWSFTHIIGNDRNWARRSTD